MRQKTRSSANGHCVLYFFNPFLAPVMQRVVENVEGSLRNDPRDNLIVYYRPQWHRLWGESPVFRRILASVWHRDWYMIYRSRTCDGQICDRSFS